MIDCQMRTEHLASLGGREIPRADFLAGVRALTAAPTLRQSWQTVDAVFDW